MMQATALINKHVNYILQFSRKITFAGSSKILQIKCFYSSSTRRSGGSTPCLFGVQQSKCSVSQPPYFQKAS